MGNKLISLKRRVVRRIEKVLIEFERPEAFVSCLFANISRLRARLTFRRRLFLNRRCRLS